MKRHYSFTQTQKTIHQKKIKQLLIQQLLLFPSILSIQQYLNHHPEMINSIILSGSSTLVQKTKAYQSLSNNTEQVLLCTHSQIFQNRNNLTSLHIADPHSPYYHTFQRTQIYDHYCDRKDEANT